jgi:hypothetical protein
MVGTSDIMQSHYHLGIIYQFQEISIGIDLQLVTDSIHRHIIVYSVVVTLEDHNITAHMEDIFIVEDKKVIGKFGNTKKNIYLCTVNTRKRFQSKETFY